MSFIDYPRHHPHPHHPQQQQQQQVRIFPRRKAFQDARPHKGKALMVDISTLQPLFGLPQEEASKLLGISVTAMKQLCRKLGVGRWPYQKPTRKEKEMFDGLLMGTISALDVSDDTSDSSSNFSDESSSTPDQIINRDIEIQMIKVPNEPRTEEVDDLSWSEQEDQAILEQLFKTDFSEIEPCDLLV
ncbi:hypothetical protein GUITHDRAFT_100821 [Guillardia theta CCMP2712]|uniref:RWP-RK domain-containing protein n=1 Tax=Guillardia theta (strain CCMP2712) TaxID=905079 RepID=L1K091_GUITC|nr:hypothetical protein GUITHDRAFT_100821 [Guillardia theta CCMP2712]EKX53855.1 hypothetical protein GUITHDRAFT_100821 [Guillardia theta CCMP2712]|eukprot:XP_005840835.1 hypothetical protein GUITHDRAFT_100821 [Guillardia theta CCMP2712]